MKNLWIPLAAVVVLMAASTASAGWVYVPPAYPASAVHFYTPAPTVYVYRPALVAPRPLVVAPRVAVVPTVVGPAPVVVRSRVWVPGRVFPRVGWTVLP